MTSRRRRRASLPATGPGVGRLGTFVATTRHRPGQALSLLLLSALVTASAVFGPLYARSVEHGLLRDALARSTVMATAAVAEAQSDGRSVPAASTVAAALPASVRTAYAAPVAMVSGQVLLRQSDRHAGADVLTTAYAPLSGCAHLRVTSGACPSEAGQVMVSTAEAAFEGWHVGDVVGLVAAPDGSPGRGAPQRAVVVGTYDQVLDDTAWFGLRLTGRAGTRSMQGLASVPKVDAPVVAPAFFAQTPEGTTTTFSYALRRDALGVDELPGLLDSLRVAQDISVDGPSTPVLRSGLDELGHTVVLGQQQAALLVPLLMGQLALLAVIVLGLAASAAVEQRRPEIALARLRGEGVRGARRLVVTELGTLVALGVPVGVVLAGLVDVVAARLWLPEGVPFDVPRGAYAAAVVALAAALGAVLLTSRRVVREPIPSLLRRVPPRPRSLAVGLLDAVVITVAGAGVVTIVSGNVSGPLAMATPALLAFAVGLLLALVVVPVASRLGHLLLRRGHVASGLTAVQLARRPAVRRLVAIVTVATALLVFATDAYLVADRNRQQRATLEAGAQVVLRTDAKEPRLVRDVLRRLDPGSRFTAPVATLYAGNTGSLATMAVVPAAMHRVALDPGGATATRIDWSKLSASAGASTELRGTRATVTLDGLGIDKVVPGADLAAGDGPPSPHGPDTLPFRLELRDGTGADVNVPLGAVPFTRTGEVRLTGRIPCASSCTLTGISVDRAETETRLIAGHVRVGSLTTDASSAIRLGDLPWAEVGTPFPLRDLQPDRPGFATVESVGADGIRLTFASTGGIVTLSTGPPALPVVVAPSPDGDSGSPASSIVGFSGSSVATREVARVAVAPGNATNVALVDFDALAAQASRLYASGSIEVWVGDATRAASVQRALEGAGVTVLSRSDLADLRRSYDRSASAWSLQLAIVIGIVALVLGALVLLLVTVTSWRTRSKDLAALRLAGVPPRRLRQVAVAEQVVVITIAALVGAVCGAVGGRLSLGLVPFFTTPSATFVRDLDPAPAAMVTAAALTLLWLALVAAGLGVWLARRATVTRVREQA
ncbi:FtsX-like permease family protein [Terrabacter sp. NPDC080008]|uniref:FtsX-like permease family protein n=1 Tax=Terrabacter sp. NPDC080008 TaxID=3155176 RepID=UPI00344FCBDE